MKFLIAPENNLYCGPDPQIARKADPNAYKVVSVRLREAEYLSFMDQIRQFGISGNLAMRIAARRIGGFLELDAGTRQNLRDLTDHVGAMSDDLHRIARQSARSGSAELEALTELRKAFGHDFARLDAALQTLLNVSQRRQDGQLMLREAAK